jgi:hypothetical protein
VLVQVEFLLLMTKLQLLLKKFGMV